MNKLIQIIGLFFNTDNYTIKNFTYYLLVIMSIQYIPLESRAGVSPIKVATMAIVALIFLLRFKLSKAVGIVFIYMLYIIYTAYFLHGNTFRASTVIYMFMFLITYATFYNFIWIEQVFEIDEFITFVKRFIYVFVCVLLLQQFFHLFGIKIFPLINMTQYFRRGVLAGNSLSDEPALFARTLGVLYYTYLKCHEFKQGHSVNIQQIFNNEHRWVTIAFGWAMFSMGSGTAFICLGVLSLYFMKGAYFVFAIPIFIGVYFTLNYFEVKQFQRATSAVEATMTNDVDAVREADGSASERIAPMLNTLHNLDLNDNNTWLGHGIDYNKIAYYRGEKRIGAIDDYGLIAYFLSLTLVFSCAIDFFSLATIMLFTGIGGGTGNVAYGWGILMFFTIIRYFRHQFKIQTEEDE